MHKEHGRDDRHIRVLTKRHKIENDERQRPLIDSSERRLEHRL
jgi:hypothetical protein